MIGEGSAAILRDEKNLLWLVLSGVERLGSECCYDVQLLARSGPDESPETLVKGWGYREPVGGLEGLLEALSEAVDGSVTALRHDPLNDGLSMELKAHRAGVLERFEVVLWLDLTGVSPAMRAQASPGRHQAGLRFFTDRDSLAAFRRSLEALVFSGAEA